MTLLALVAGELDQMNWEVDSLDEIRTIFKQDPYFENSAHHQNPQAVRLVQLGYLSVPCSQPLSILAIYRRWI